MLYTQLLNQPITLRMIGIALLAGLLPIELALPFESTDASTESTSTGHHHRFCQDPPWHRYQPWQAGSPVDCNGPDDGHGPSTYSAFMGRVEASDTQPVEVGVKFCTDVNGEVSAIRFYRDVPIDSGYAAHLWSTTGQLLGGGVAIEGQGPTPGWQTIQLSPPVPILAGQIYIASYYASQGRYTVSENFFTQATIRSGPLYLLSNKEEGGNGVYVYGAGGGFPTETYCASNYWVDVIFEPMPSP